MPSPALRRSVEPVQVPTELARIIQWAGLSSLLSEGTGKRIELVYVDVSIRLYQRGTS